MLYIDNEALGFSLASGGVPVTRKINGKTLETDITLTAADVSAASADDVGNVSELTTTSKIVVSAINEINATVSTLNDSLEEVLTGNGN